MSGYRDIGPALLIWVGEKFYKSGTDFIRESRSMGISRFIQHIPKGFELGKTWVLLAHRKAIEIAPVFSPHPVWQAGIFSMFKPTRIEIIVTGKEPDSVIEDYVKRGLTPVLIQRLDEKKSDLQQPGLFGHGS